jgi:hypothetical protein
MNNKNKLILNLLLFQISANSNSKRNKAFSISKIMIKAELNFNAQPELKKAKIKRVS